MIDLSSKVALVTGAASPDGIGFACARRLARQGARVFLTDIATEAVMERAGELRGAGHDALAAGHDVSDEADWTRIVAAVVEAFGALDIIVNNAGFAVNKRIEDTSAAEWDRQLRVNLDGVFYGTKDAIAQMRRQGRGGSIVNISSVAGLVGFPNSIAYSASKGGVRMLTKAAAVECAAEGIRVNSVHPGMIMSDIHRIAMAQNEALYRENMGSSLIPMGGMGEPDDIASAVAFLASDEAKYITGIELAVDGGLVAK